MSKFLSQKEFFYTSFEFVTDTTLEGKQLQKIEASINVRLRIQVLETFKIESGPGKLLVLVVPGKSPKMGSYWQIRGLKSGLGSFLKRDNFRITADPCRHVGKSMLLQRNVQV